MWAEMIEQEEYELMMPNATPNTVSVVYHKLLIYAGFDKFLQSKKIYEVFNTHQTSRIDFIFFIIESQTVAYLEIDFFKLEYSKSASKKVDMNFINFLFHTIAIIDSLIISLEHV